MKITDDAIRANYEMAKKVYENEMTETRELNI
jgi:hypothetical protein